jgi:hypothetical protein
VNNNQQIYYQEQTLDNRFTNKGVNDIALSEIQTELNLKANIASPTFTGTVTGITKVMVGLGNVDNTTDIAKPISTLTQNALSLKAPLASPAFTGTVTGITKTMVGLGNVDNTSDIAKPISTLAQTALNLKANIASPTFTGTVTGITKAMVGLGSVDNTSDAAKPISTLVQTALNLKANIESPTFTGIVTGNEIIYKTQTLDTRFVNQTDYADNNTAITNNSQQLADNITAIATNITVIDANNIATNASIDALDISLNASIDANLISVNASIDANLISVNASIDANNTATNALIDAIDIRVSTNTTNLANKATTDYVDIAVANIVNGSPALLDTLSELATALGNNPDFANEVLALIGTNTTNLNDAIFSIGANNNLRIDGDALKLDKTGGIMTGAINSRRVLNANNQNAEILTMATSNSDTSIRKFSIKHLSNAGGSFRMGIFSQSNIADTDTEVLTISANNVGIGITTPTSKLHVDGTANITGGLTVGDRVTISGTDLMIWNPTRGGLGLSSGRALVHIGSGSKETSKLHINFSNDFGAGTEITGALAVIGDLTGQTITDINNAIALNTAKIGITSEQSTAISNIPAGLATKLDKTGGTMTGNLNVNGTITVGGGGENKDLLYFDTTRDWKFKTIGIGAANELVLQSMNSKIFRIRDHTDTDRFMFNTQTGDATITRNLVVGDALTGTTATFSGQLTANGLVTNAFVNSTTNTVRLKPSFDTKISWFQFQNSTTTDSGNNIFDFAIEDTFNRISTRANRDLVLRSGTGSVNIESGQLVVNGTITSPTITDINNAINLKFNKTGSIFGNQSTRLQLNPTLLNGNLGFGSANFENISRQFTTEAEAREYYGAREYSLFRQANSDFINQGDNGRQGTTHSIKFGYNNNYYNPYSDGAFAPTSHSMVFGVSNITDGGDSDNYLEPIEKMRINPNEIITSVNLIVNGSANINGDLTVANGIKSHTFIKQWDLNYTSLLSTLFYPIVFECFAGPGKGEFPTIDFEIFGESLLGSNPFNEESIKGYYRPGGWTDHTDFYEYQTKPYSISERRLSQIWRGSATSSSFAVYVRGGYRYSVRTNADNVGYLTGNGGVSNAVFTAGNSIYGRKNFNGSDNLSSGMQGSSNIGYVSDIITSTKVVSEALLIKNLALAGAGTRGVSVLASGVLVTTSSDFRLKENFELINESETHLKVLKLKPVTYQWKNREKYGDLREIGLIAQDVEEVLPGLVFTDNDGMYGIYYDRISTLMLLSIKQLQKQIDELNITRNTVVANLQATGSVNITGALSVGSSISMSGTEFYLWNTTSGGVGTSIGRALVHLGSRSKASSVLSINHKIDFGGGTLINGLVNITGQLTAQVASIGNFGLSDMYARFCHTNFKDATDANDGKYALLQDINGRTFINSASGQPINFRNNNNGSDVMTIASSGNVGIGTTSPTEKLDVNGNINVQGNLDILSAGNSHIGSNLPRNYLTNVGGTELRTFNNNTYDTTARFLPNGIDFLKSIWVKGNISRSSDERLKENIKPLDESETHLKILQLQPKSYQMIDRECDDNTIDVGLIAQQVKPIFPELVYENDDGMMSLFYDKVSVLMLQSIKQLQKQIDELNNENIKMKNEIIELRRDVSPTIPLRPQPTIPLRPEPTIPKPPLRPEPTIPKPPLRPEPTIPKPPLRPEPTIPKPPFPRPQI